MHENQIDHHMGSTFCTQVSKQEALCGYAPRPRSEHHDVERRNGNFHRCELLVEFLHEFLTSENASKPSWYKPASSWSQVIGRHSKGTGGGGGGGRGGKKERECERERAISNVPLMSPYSGTYAGTSASTHSHIFAFNHIIQENEHKSF